ncbi:Rad17 cell cycle checkpoint protein-domain-containing protein [Obelidium mucronatum]|nr:Rad17 cell cycle checkpoint protein-domain-containing protein [Obelidium mucronatum]
MPKSATKPNPKNPKPKKRKTAPLSQIADGNESENKPKRKAAKFEVDEIDDDFGDAQSELAVHKRKINDVRSWLQDALSTSENSALRRIHKSHRLLALTGISGTGKTALIRMLSMELNFEIVEWINPINEFGLDTTNDVDDFYSEDGSWQQPRHQQSSSSTSVIQKFIDFIASARKTNALSFGSSESFTNTKPTPKVILIEDLPNLSTHSSKSAFHSILRTHVFGGGGADVHPIVLILSDTIASAVSSSEEGFRSRGYETVMNLKNLVPEDFLTLFDKLPDISSSSTSSKDVGNRDVNLIFFHALNKILIGKRLESNETADEFPGQYSESLVVTADGGGIKVPTHLKYLERKPLKSNPEHVFESSHTDADGFISYLAENYTSTFTEIEECVAAIDSYCDADILSGSWKNRPTMSNYSASIACRGTLFARTQAAPPQKFGALRKPGAIQSYLAKRETLELISEACLRWNLNWFKNRNSVEMIPDLLQISSSYTASALTMELLPYAAGIIQSLPGSKGFQDKNLFNRICFYSNHGSLLTASHNLLDETDVGGPESEHGENSDMRRYNNSGGMHKMFEQRGFIVEADSGIVDGDDIED